MLTALTLLTFNFWGLPDVGTLSLSLLKEERAQVLCEKIKVLSEQRKIDVIALQEVWDRKDRKTLSDCGFDYAVDLNDGLRMIDNGLLILSRYPLAETPPLKVTYEKPAQGDLSHFDGESMADKAVIVARFQLPDGTTFVVGDTHLISNYTHYPEYDPYEHLRNQEFKLAVDTITRFKSAPTEPAFLLGDFNTGPTVDGRKNLHWNELASQLIYDRTKESVCTVCSENPFQDGSNDRMDFVFSLPGAFLVLKSESRQFDRLETLLPQVTGYLSDHYAWEATYSIAKPPQLGQAFFQGENYEIR